MFTVLVILIILSVSILTFFRVGKTLEVEDFADYKELLINEKYSEIPSKEILGKEGSFVIANDKNEINYRSSGDTKLLILNSDEIKYIRNYASRFSIKSSNYYTSKNEKQTFITIEGEAYNKEKFEDRYILDENHAVIYSSTGDEMVKSPKSELSLLTYALDGDFTIDTFHFHNNDGEENIVISYHSNEIGDIETEKLISILGDSWKLFVLLYFILIVFFILWFQRKVRKPLRILQKGLAEFSQGQQQQYLSYKGPIEFVEIFESFNQMSRRLHKSEFERMKAEEDKKQMLADISHDLKTPITVIQGYAKAINDGIIPKEEKAQYINAILQRSISLNELINTFHEYSKMEHPNYKIELERSNIAVFLRDYMADKYNEFELAGFNIEIEIPEEQILCYINKMQLKRALENIVSNVIKHNNAGTTLYCTLKRVDRKIKIILSDDGKGIPAEITADIFKPFSVGEKSRTKHSSGLGLAISKKIIEAHNGEIILKTEEKSQYNSIFEITLPMN